MHKMRELCPIEAQNKGEGRQAYRSTKAFALCARCASAVAWDMFLSKKAMAQDNACENTTGKRLIIAGIGMLAYGNRRGLDPQTVI